ncbi:hypothetical protein RI129_011582 [Pyrocoelia pectoralis]|uniref:Transcription initiation factor IIA subunit 1 n=1 Tax=Pyrocoelia pectoralis TaxID=417401 RepID=A0AAN7UWN9_9COLE
MSLPQALASSVLQQHVNAALNSQQQTVTIGSIVNKSVIQTDGVIDSSSSDEDDLNCIDVLNQPGSSRGSDGKVFVLKQIDGARDTSDDDDQGSDDDDASDEADDDKDDDEQEMEEGGPEEEPLNSEDDVTDEDPTDVFDTDNVVVCQYDKITRSRNKWKFHLKDGIMNLNGEDFIFQKATGDAEW